MKRFLPVLGLLAAALFGGVVGDRLGPDGWLWGIISVSVAVAVMYAVSR